MRKCYEHSKAVTKLIQKEVAWGHVIELDYKPWSDMCFSPLQIVEKPDSNIGWRLIHDLKYPYIENKSVNGCISDVASSVKYKSVQDVIEMCLKDELTWGVHFDIQHAFRNLPVSLRDIHYLAFSWQGKVYLNSSIPFGARSSCKIFNDIADLL